MLKLADLFDTLNNGVEFEVYVGKQADSVIHKVYQKDIEIPEELKHKRVNHIGVGCDYTDNPFMVIELEA